MLLVAIMIGHFASSQILAWDFNGAAGNETSLASTTTNANLASSSVTRGSGVVATALANAFSANSWDNASLAVAITNNDYFQFTVTVNTGFTVSLSTLDAAFRRSSTGPNAFQWQYSLDGFSTAGINIGSSISYTLTTSNGDAQAQINLSGISALQNVPNGTVITIRLYGWGASAPAGTFALGRISGNDLAIGGTTAPSACSGIPTGQAGFGSITPTSVTADINVTAGTGGTGRVVKINTTNTFTDLTDGDDPTAALAYVSGEQVVYNGTGTGPFTVTGLTASTTYYLGVYEYNCASGRFYLNPAATTSFATDAACVGVPSVQAGFGTITPASTSADVNVTAGTGGVGRVVKVNTANSFTNMTDGDDPTADLLYVSGEQVVYNGTGTGPFTVTGLAASTTYYLGVYEYNCLVGRFYLNPAATTSFMTTAPPPPGLQLTAANTNYVIDFDNTVADVNNGQYAGTGFTTSPAAGQLNSNAWATTGMSDGASTFGSSYIAGDFAKGTSAGGVSSGGFYAFTVGIGNNAMGVQPTGADWNPGTITLRMQNKTGGAITTLGVLYKIFVLNNEARDNSFNFSYSTDNTSYTPVAAMDYTSALAADGSPAWKGNLRSLSLTGLSVADGDFIYIRWSGVNIGGSGSQDEFALDDISIVANPTTVFPSAGSSIDEAIITGDVTLSSNLSIANSLALNGGKVFLGDYDLSLVNFESTALKSYSDNSYVVTNGTGSFKRGVQEDTYYAFPIGNTANLQLAQIDFTVGLAGGSSALNTLSSKFINGSGGANGLPLSESGDNIQKTSGYGYWEVNAEFPSPNEYKGTFTAKGFVDIIDYTKLHLVKRDNSASPWVLNGNHTTTTGSNSLAVLERTGISGFSQFGVGGQNNVSLPVKFVDVSAAKSGSAIRIAWSNLTELNITDYKVERSANGQQFTAINTQNAMRNDGGKAIYSQIDASPISGVSYYRISATELDGKKFYSIIVKVDTRQSNTTDINLYPNPVRDGQFVMQIPELNAGKYKIQVFNAVGQQVLTQTIEHLGGFAIRSVQLPSGSAPGVYTLILADEAVKMTKAFLVQ